MNSDERRKWAMRIHRVAAQTLGTSPPLESTRQFWDELGNVLPIDGPFFAALRGEPYVVDRTAPIDMRLWSGEIPEELRVEPRPSVPTPLLASWNHTTGGGWQALEVETEREICAIHALWRRSRIHQDEQLSERAFSAAAWAVANLQPDNATNYPWAVHVMLLLATRREYAEARLYAETLLHNCQIAHARPDRRSAWILYDAAMELRFSW